MLYIKGNTISLTRGDTAYLTVPITSALGEEYTLSAKDTLTLSVKKNTSDTEYLFQKVLTGTNVFHIEPQDTASIPFGMYKYDIQLNTANGDVYTIIDVSTFVILEEVTS
jgi:hypothetical protein